MTEFLPHQTYWERIRNERVDNDFYGGQIEILYHVYKGDTIPLTTQRWVEKGETDYIRKPLECIKQWNEHIARIIPDAAIKSFWLEQFIDVITHSTYGNGCVDRGGGDRIHLRKIFFNFISNGFDVDKLPFSGTSSHSS